MPSKSPAQHRLMEAAAHTKGGFGGVPQKVGKEFVQADKGKTMKMTKKAMGGSTNPMDYDSDVDYYEARDKSMMGVPSGMKTALKGIKKDIRGQQEAYAAKQRDSFAKSVAAAKAKKSAQPKAKGGKVNSCW